MPYDAVSILGYLFIPQIIAKSKPNFTLRLAIVINHVTGFSWPTYETSVTILAHVA